MKNRRMPVVFGELRTDGHTMALAAFYQHIYVIIIETEKLNPKCYLQEFKGPSLAMRFEFVFLLATMFDSMGYSNVV